MEKPKVIYGPIEVGINTAREIAKNYNSPAIVLDYKKFKNIGLNNYLNQNNIKYLELLVLINMPINYDFFDFYDCIRTNPIRLKDGNFKPSLIFITKSLKKRLSNHAKSQLDYISAFPRFNSTEETSNLLKIEFTQGGGFAGSSFHMYVNEKRYPLGIDVLGNDDTAKTKAIQILKEEYNYTIRVADIEFKYNGRL